MRRLLAPLLASLACTANPPPEQQQPPAIDSPPATPPPTSERDRPLVLEPDELMRIRGTGGACDDLSMLVVHADGRFARTTHDGCQIGPPRGTPRAPRAPEQPEVKSAQLSADDLAQLNRLLGEPTLAHTLESIKGGSGSAHPHRLEFLVRTPTGEARGEYIGHRMRERSAFHAFVDSLYARL